MKNRKYIVTISFLMCLLFGTQSFAFAEEKKDESFNPGEVIIEHVLDSYEWHIFTWKGHEVSV